jgi:GntR family transcriptional regulator, transcriptional repressor for pyruvate dehydrogenase complex
VGSTGKIRGPAARQRGEAAPTAQRARGNRLGSQEPRPSSVAGVRAGTLSEQIATRIRDLLFSGDLAPGDFVGTEASIADAFDVSRMAARDAVRSLAAMGIVRVRAGKQGGVLVADGNLELIADAIAVQSKLARLTRAELMESLIGVEMIGADFAARRATDDDIERMEVALERLMSNPHRNTDFVAASQDFHELLIGASRNRALLMQFRALRQVIEPDHVRALNPAVRGRVQESCSKLLALVRAGDNRGARQHMYDRLDDVRSRSFNDLDEPGAEPRRARVPLAPARPPARRGGASKR